MLDSEERRKVQEEFGKLVDVFPQYMSISAADGRRLYANDTLLEFFGMTQQEFVADDFRKRAFHPDDLARVEATLAQAISRGERWEMEARIRGKDGQYRWVLIRVRPLRDERGVITRWYSVGTDIEDRKQAQHELQQLVDAVPEHIIVLDGDGRRLYANRAALDYHGYSLDHFLIVDHDECFHPDDLKRYDRLRHEGITKGERWQAEIRLRRKDGQYRWFLMQANPLRDDRGRIVRWYLARTDIEGRKQAEREIQQLVDSVPQLILVLAADGTRLYANKVVLDFHGCTLEEFLDQKTSHQRVHPSDLVGYLDIRRRGISNGVAFQTEIRLLSKSGEYRWFLAQFNPSKDEHGRVARWYATATDIQDRKQAEESLRRSEAYLEEAQELSHTGSFAHDVARNEIVYWSAQSYRNFGFDPDNGSIPWNQARARIHPDDRVKVDECQQRAVREKAPTSVDFRVLLPDGSVRHVHSQCRPMLNAANAVVKLVGTNIDVTEQYNSRMALEKALEENKRLKDELYRENLVLKEEIDQASMFEEIVGTSDALRHVLVHVAKVARADSTILISGETGTGKELIARAIHKRSPRSSRPFVSVNCAAIPQTLIGSELFGHEKGAFTGATERRLGRFELADGGTLFLDEVGDLPPETQIALLRVLQERQFERVGGNQSIAVNVRVIAATNRDLKEAVAAGTFRSDLFYRLNVFPIAVPALRDRKADIPLLLEYLIDRYANKMGKKFKSIQKRTMELFLAYDWPGNIRELQNVVERAVILCDGETFMLDDSWLPSESPRKSQPEAGLARLGSDQEKKLIEKALAESEGRVAGPTGAAARLGIPRSTLETKIRKLGIKKHQFNPN
jgi:PAS domain S-box-containing protein